MVSKDQAIGGLIFLVCAIVIIGYITALFFYDNTKLGISIKKALSLPWSSSSVSYWLVALPVFIAFIAVLGIGAVSPKSNDQSFRAHVVPTNLAKATAAAFVVGRLRGHPIPYLVILYPFAHLRDLPTELMADDDR